MSDVLEDRVLMHASKVRALIRSGRKPNGDPLGNLEDLEQELALSLEERFRWQEIKSLAVQDGTLTTEEGMTLYRAIGETGTDHGWPKRTDLALRVSVTSLMAQLMPKYLRGIR